MLVEFCAVFQHLFVVLSNLSGMVKSAPFEGRCKSDKFATSESHCGSSSIFEDFFEAVGNVLRAFS